MCSCGWLVDCPHSLALLGGLESTALSSSSIVELLSRNDVTHALEAMSIRLSVYLSPAQALTLFITMQQSIARRRRLWFRSIEAIESF